MLPHVASATHETRQAMANLVLENLQAFFATGRVKAAFPFSSPELTHGTHTQTLMK